MLEITELHRLLKYDPETGVLTWRVSRGPRAAGAVAGCASAGDYVRVRLNWRLELGHRVAWAMTHGEWPESLIDHINGDRADNRIANLRLANKQQNVANCKGKPNRTGYKGVTQVKDNRWTAEIRVAGKKQFLGTYDCPAKAHERFMEAARQHYGEFAWRG